ncbi:MAG: radical SAM family heme chaperone HemW [Actinomycetia bacterium]|nr:radical SAM family heme chaperone HemW [Actinomycetes bacterium]
MTGFGVYVHWPFCPTRCAYCDFAAIVDRGRVPAERYARALLVELAAVPLPEGPVLSVFFGGGTPSLAPPAVIGRLLEALARRRTLAGDAEVTLEANPGTVDVRRAAAWREAGVTRVSLGVQARQAHHLAALGRDHSARDAETAVAAVRAAGFDNLNCDLIYGLPGQTVAEWEDTLTWVGHWAPEHVSAYQLEVEPGTRLWRAVRRGEVAPPDSDLVADLALLAETHLDAAGLRRYEVSNWARPGRESVHNRLYWTQMPYVGLGAGAHSFDGRTRRWNVRGVLAYLRAVEAGRLPEAGREDLDAAHLAGEFVWLGLRQIEGVRLDVFRRRFGRPLQAAFPGVAERLERLGLLESDGVRLRLSRRGLDLYNRVAQEFLTARLS